MNPSLQRDEGVHEHLERALGLGGELPLTLQSFAGLQKAVGSGRWCVAREATILRTR
jgi:hypothetical protein